MTTSTQGTTTEKVFRVYIKATPEAIWEAITAPGWGEKYGYRGRTEYDLKPGGSYQAFATAEMVSFGLPEVVVDGEVVESDPPHKLVQTYRFHFSPDHVAEGFTTLTWEIVEETDQLSSLTVTHDVTGAPLAEAAVTSIGKLEEGGGGWAWILSDLKTLLETGSALEL